MSDDQQQSPPPQRTRRSSFAGQTLSDLFGGGRNSVSRPANETNNTPPSPSQQQQLPGPISQAAHQAQQRRLSLTTLGLSGSQNQTSPFGSYRGRKDSLSSANSGSIDESAIAEDDGPAPTRDPNNSPFARRTSFGARALRDIRTTSFGSNGGGNSPPAQNGNNEGFNWSDNFHNRAKRTSIAGQGGGGPAFGGGNHSRAKSVAVMEPPPASQMPKPKEQNRPDHFQERILKGDFYMD